MKYTYLSPVSSTTWFQVAMSLGLVTSFLSFSVQTYLKGVIPPVGHNAAHALAVIPHTLKVKIDHLNNIDEVYS